MSPHLHAALVLASVSASAHLQCSASGLDEIPRLVIATNAEFWWARAAADLNGDGIVDLVLQNNNAHGGWLGWLEGRLDGLPWTTHLIAPQAPDGQTFSSGDLDVGDIDNDGDTDVLGFAHPGEWDDAKSATRVYWFENPSRTGHFLGEFPAFVKDVNLADLNGDGRLDLVGACFEGSLLRIFRQDTPEHWVAIQSLTVPNLHEGLDVGDLDGDGDLDIAANGYWLENPGAEMTGAWTLRSIHASRHNQTGDWSRNATKVACADLNGDGRAEVLITHSERAGYPVAWYSSVDPKTGPWTQHILVDDLPAAHTLQVFDANLDGSLDVLTGVNRERGEALGLQSWPVQLLLGQPNGLAWDPVLLTDQGIYNGQVADVDADGDLDLFHLDSHAATRLDLWLNPTRQADDRVRLTFADSPTGALPTGWRQGFTGEGTTDWQVLETAGNRVLAQTISNNPNRHFQLAWFTPVQARNLSLTVQVRAASGQHDQGGGLVWRVLDERNYYVVRLNPLENNVVLYKVEDGHRTSLPMTQREGTYGMQVPALGNRWHTLAVDVHEDAFSVSLNGQSLFQVRDSTFGLAGHFGVWSKADAVTWFDDLQAVLHR